MYNFIFADQNMCKEAKMSVSKKKLLSQICYYTLAILAVLSSVFFLTALSKSAIPGWARVVYYIWIALIIGSVIFDVVCTRTHEGKFLSGIIIYVLSILSVIVPIVLYYMNTGDMGILPDFFNVFITVSLISFMNVGLTIATWVVGESMVEHETAEVEIARREN